MVRARRDGHGAHAADGRRMDRFRGRVRPPKGRDDAVVAAVAEDAAAPRVQRSRHTDGERVVAAAGLRDGPAEERQLERWPRVGPPGWTELHRKHRRTRRIGLGRRSPICFANASESFSLRIFPWASKMVSPVDPSQKGDGRDDESSTAHGSRARVPSTWQDRARHVVGAACVCRRKRVLDRVVRHRDDPRPRISVDI